MGGGEVEMAHHLVGYNHFSRSTLLNEKRAFTPYKNLHSLESP